LYSRHSYVQQVAGGDPIKNYLTDRTKFRFVDLPDNTLYQVQSGDRLTDIAARFYAALDRPETGFYSDSLWWIIADFQPRPIHDPTIALMEGQTLVVPSLRTVRDRVLTPPGRR